MAVGADTVTVYTTSTCPWCTRAKDFLEVVFPLKYYHKKHRTGDAHSYAQLTRFLPESILNHFQKISLQPKPQLDLPAKVSQSDIKKKIAAMWS